MRLELRPNLIRKTFVFKVMLIVGINRFLFLKISNGLECYSYHEILFRSNLQMALSFSNERQN